MHVTDSTPSRIRRLSTALIVAALALAVVCPMARADGDPASDVLAQQSLFLPQDAGLSAARQAELSGLIQEAAGSGYALKVAVVASQSDLGAVTALWNQPQLYARFLGQELSPLNRTRLLVVMPEGVGVSGPGEVKRAPAAVNGLRTTGQADLGAVAVAAIQRLTTAAGLHLKTPAATSITAPAGSRTAEWVALAVGALLIASAWTLSLRARPPGWRRTGARALEPPATR